MIQVRGLTKFYGRLPAIKDVNFRVESGEIVGFLGPNGAGKTTTMRILTCFSPATAGEVKILDMDVRDKSLEIRRKVGYLPENVPLYSWMRVKSYLGFVARAKGVSASDREREIQRVAAAVGIDHVMERIIRALSKGYRQRVGLAQALIGDPPILVLDEPTIGLDPRQIREIRELVKSFARNRTVILSTHILPEVSQVCDRVIIINKGTIVAEDSPSNLTRSHTKSSRLAVTVKASVEELKAALGAVPGVQAVNVKDVLDDGLVRAVVESIQDGDTAPMIARAVVEKGWDLLALSPIDVSLEDVFIDLVTEEQVPEDTPSLEGGKEAA
jgi:ABC-2 type transport system ATP-binding protein